MTQSHEADAGETLFGFDELFFSRTDASGVIQFGNSVFQRVSVYGWDELIGKPHKIVRHPDTPRAVFWLLWETLKRGAPIAAYVKNRAKDGRFYWVFAIATPIEGGYLSVRLRPSSELFAVVKEEYAALAALERANNLSPADSAALLLGRLGELGFDAYSAFMASALGAELAARDQSLGRAPDPAIQRFEDLRAAARVLLGQAEIISAAYLGSENVPFNFRVLAAQLGQDGAAIGVISANYTLLSAEMKSMLDAFTSAALKVYSAINDGYFLACAARVQREMLECFAGEHAGEEASRAREMHLLDCQQRDYRARALTGLQEIAREAHRFHQTCTEMARLSAGLEVTRIMGKVECSRHLRVKDRLDELLCDLEAFQRTVATALREIGVKNQAIQQQTGALLADAAA